MLPRGYFLPREYAARRNAVSSLPQEGFTADQRARLAALHRQYEQAQDNFDNFNERELAHLYFLRWLVAKGRITA